MPALLLVMLLQVAEALRERAQRIYDKYGTMMLNTEGMTAEGVERKATCQALVSKLLYLTEYQPLVSQGSEAFKATDLRMVSPCFSGRGVLSDRCPGGSLGAWHWIAATACTPCGLRRKGDTGQSGENGGAKMHRGTD